MKILYIITQGEYGGAQKNVLESAIYFNEEGHQVSVIIGNMKNESDKWLFNKIVEYNNLEKKQEGYFKKDLDKKLENNIHAYCLTSLVRPVNLIKDFVAFWQTFKMVKKIKPEIVHVHSSKAGIVSGIASYLAGAKVVYTAHGFVFNEPMFFLTKWFYICAEWISARFRHFTVVVSKQDLNFGFRKGFFKPQNSQLIFNGIDQVKRDQILSREDAFEFLRNKVNYKFHEKIEKENFVVGTVANLYPTKGLDYLVEVADIIVNKKEKREYMFVVFGEGVERPKLEKMISDKKLYNNFFLVGRVEDAYKFLRGFDLFVLPSLKEGFPYSILEAISAGLPVIATSVGAVPEMSNYVDIKVIESKSIVQLKDAILSYRETPAPVLPPIFSLENGLKTLSTIYQNLV